jgi:hypothetical protein
VQATNPDAVFVASYPVDSVGMVRAASEVGLNVKLFGGGMVGLQTTSVKQQLGPLLNGIVNYDFWIPAKTLQFPGVMDFLKKYQEKAAKEGVDPLGYYLTERLPTGGAASVCSICGRIFSIACGEICRASKPGASGSAMLSRSINST